MTNCIQSSCWCAPIRWMMKCCSKSNSPVTQVALETINHTTHHQRTRTWKASVDGKMRYEVSQTVVRVETR